MQPFTRLTAIAAPFDRANIDTDQIIPARDLSMARGPGYERWGFHDMRYDTDGREKPDFVLNQAPYRNAQILVAGANFGCGSSREAAVYALLANGIRSVIAPSFGDIHYGNELQNGMLPVVLPTEITHRLCGQLQGQPGVQITVDLESQIVTGPDGAMYHFDIDPNHRERLLKGLDDIALVMQNIEKIEVFEVRYHDELPWLA